MTATGTGDGELRRIDLDDLATKLTESGYTPLLRTSDGKRYLYLDDLEHIEIDIWEDGAVRAGDQPLDLGLVVEIARHLDAIAEAVLAPEGGTLTAAEREAIKTAVAFAEWMAEEDPWLEDFKVSSVPGGRRFRELVEMEGFDFPSADQITLLKALVERASGV